jgi:hypothetical protein
MVRKLALAIALTAGLGVATSASAGYHHHHHHKVFVWKDVCYWKSFYHYGEWKKVWFCKKVLVRVYH